MTKPYSEDLRTRVVAAVAAGASCRYAARQFSIGVSTVVRWARRFRQTGSVAAKPMGGDRNSRLKDERDWLLARVARSAASRRKARACRAPYPRRLWHDLALFRQGEDHL